MAAGRTGETVIPGQPCTRRTGRCSLLIQPYGHGSAPCARHERLPVRLVPAPVPALSPSWSCSLDTASATSLQPCHRSLLLCSRTGSYRPSHRACAVESGQYQLLVQRSSHLCGWSRSSFFCPRQADQPARVQRCLILRSRTNSVCEGDRVSSPSGGSSLQASVPASCTAMRSVAAPAPAAAAQLAAQALCCLAPGALPVRACRKVVAPVNGPAGAGAAASRQRRCAGSDEGPDLVI